MNRTEIIAQLHRWDPMGDEDLPDAVAEAIDRDAEVRAIFDACFEPVPLPEPAMPADLVDTVLPRQPSMVAAWVLAAMTLLALGLSSVSEPVLLAESALHAARAVPVPMTTGRSLMVAHTDPVVELMEGVHSTTGGPLRRAPWPGGAVTTMSTGHTLVTELLAEGQRPPAGLVHQQGLLDGVRWTSPGPEAALELVESPDDPSEVLALVRVRIPTGGIWRHDLAIGLDLSARTQSLRPVADALASVADALPPGGAVGVVGAAGQVFVEPGGNLFAARLASLVPASRPGVARALEPAAEMARELQGHVVLLTDAADDHPATWALAVQQLRMLRGLGTQVHVVGLDLDVERRRLVTGAAALGGASYADATARNLKDVLVREMYRAPPSEALEAIEWSVGGKRVLPREGRPSGGEVAGGVHTAVVASLVRLDRADLMLGRVAVDLQWGDARVESLSVHHVVPFEEASADMVTAAAWEQVAMALQADGGRPAALRRSLGRLHHLDDPRVVEATQVLHALSR